MNRVLFSVLVGGFLMTASVAFAKPPFVKKAQALGFKDVTGCKSCHESTKPVKFNDRGTWLSNKKKEVKASAVDVAWLKDYKPAE